MKLPKSKVALWCLIALFAILSSLPFLVVGAGPLALLSFTPLFCMDAICRKENIRNRFLYFFVAFLLFNVGATYWIWYVSEIGAVGAILANTLFMTLAFYIPSIASRRCGKWGVHLQMLFFVTLWLAWEHLYHDIELSWPWLTLGNAFATSPKLIQWYEITGPLGGSLWILLCSILAYAAIVRMAEGRKKPAAILAGILLLTALFPSCASLVRYYSYQEKGEPFEVALAQPNVDPFMKYGKIAQQELDSTLLALFDEVVTPQTKYVITPETFTYDIDLDDPSSNSSVRKYTEWLAAHPGTDMLLGALTFKFYMQDSKPTPYARKSSFGWYDVYNSALMLTEGGQYPYYHKSKLVPGVEIVPWQNSIRWLGPLMEKCGGSANSYGIMTRMIPLAGNDGHKAAPMICYESIYADWSRHAVKAGADFLAVITNDGWWGDSPGYRQHFRYASLRAIENRRDLVHVANTGISGFINQRGDVISKTGWWVKTALAGEVHGNRSLTYFSKKGDLIGRLCGPAAIALGIICLCLSVWGILPSRGKSAARKS